MTDVNLVGRKNRVHRGEPSSRIRRDCDSFPHPMEHPGFESIQRTPDFDSIEKNNDTGTTQQQRKSHWKQMNVHHKNDGCYTRATSCPYSPCCKPHPTFVR